MDDLNSFKEKLEANLLTLNKFEGLETDLIQQHGNLRAQFSEYREAIEAANLNENDKREHYKYHDDLIKKLHKLILEAKTLARKRTEQMTRDELFKLSQEHQKTLKPQSAENKIGEEVTKSLKRMLETMRTEVERSSSNISTACETSKNLKGTTENYEKLSGTLEESRSLIRDLWKKNRNDMIYIIGALGVFIATAMYVIIQRTPGIFWLPGKLIIRQFGNLVLNSSEKVVGMNKIILKDKEDVPDMFIDRILKKEEYGNDELLKQEDHGKEKDISSEGESSTSKEEQVSTSSPFAEKPETFIPNFTESAENTGTAETKEVNSPKESHEYEMKEKIIEPKGDNKSNEHAKTFENNVLSKKVESEPVKQAIVINLDKNPQDIENIQTNETPFPQVLQIDLARIPETIKESISTTETVYSNTGSAIVIGEGVIVNETEASVVSQISPVTINTSVTEESAGPDEILLDLDDNKSEIIQTLTIEPLSSGSVSTSTNTLQKPSEATEASVITQDKPFTTSPTTIKIATESIYHSTTDSESEGSQNVYSSEAELFSGNEEKMEL